jgi:NCAIR mutase (PurE)-related protein
MFDPGDIHRLLERVASGEQSPEQAMDMLRSLPFESIEHATIDSHRALRQGFAEVIFCQGKTNEQVAQIVAHLGTRSDRVLGTRASPEQFQAASAALDGLEYDATARLLWLDRDPDRPRRSGAVVVAAGTSDLPVAREAALTLRLMGHEPETISDVGVAGLHRLLNHVPALQRANVVIAVAGMEGALPSVVAGLVAAPVIAVPTSIGYGASFGGLAALLAMLNSCASGVGVVNIDNGYGAGHLAAIINERCASAVPDAATDGGAGDGS